MSTAIRRYPWTKKVVEALSPLGVIFRAAQHDATDGLSVGVDPGGEAGRRVYDAPMTAPEAALYAAIAYFAVFGAAFLVRPGLVGRFGLRWVNDAGKTEVRCYYGAVSCALAAFLVYLRTEDLTIQALTGVLFLAGAVLLVRLVSTAADGAWSDEYNKTALPVEALFVVGLLAVRLTA